MNQPIEEYDWSINRWVPVYGERNTGLARLFTDRWSEHVNELFNSAEDELEDNKWELIKDLGYERMFFSSVTHEFKSVRTGEGRALPKRRTRTKTS